ncbi:hypothetical protein CASFOL_034684 [Castilleja foliolosa]|uniref:Uncharacterized protein n=1 Tax=Castilleja foliolosa TaxID=1961234 RepID=A0ABD3BST3_9LAMI
MGHSNVWNSHPKTYGPGSRTCESWLLLLCFRYRCALSFRIPLRSSRFEAAGQFPFEASPKQLSSTLHNVILIDIDALHMHCTELRGLNLTGTLPVEFVNLTYLREIDLTRNYLNGTIPRMFGLLRVVNVSLIGNRLSGRIPDEIGDITTLEELVLEDNYLEGNLSASLGRLRNLSRRAGFNSFNGTIPETYGNLRNLTDFRIVGSNMSGRIPDFIGNWTRLSRLAGCILAELFAGSPL